MSGPWDFACMVAWLVVTVFVGGALWLDEWCTARLARLVRRCDSAAQRCGMLRLTHPAPGLSGYAFCAWAFVPVPWPWFVDFGVTAGWLRHGSWGLRLGLGGCTLELSAEIHRQDRPRP